MSKTIDQIMEEQASHFEVTLEAAKNTMANLPWGKALNIAQNNGGNFEEAAVFMIASLQSIMPIILKMQKQTEDQALDTIAELDVGDGI